ncbi:TfuA-like protein [Sorangium sp. So ce1000]|uniref:TfuA-like protein n=1 Tax=Sorangium sp. So ce1000 TaxID=3133325 RepID=UPI003F648498
MTTCIFLGPTLTAAEARAELDAVYLPPAAQGDVYRASLGKPDAIGIIDGYFERVPSIWHKEILWAMSQGIHVYGSASMGALRAVELHPFGMEGVGAIFEAFQRGELEDDDEVAVIHAPAEDGYRPLSDAMVNIRSTLAKAASEGVISAAGRAALERVAKDLHYTERSYGLVLAKAAESGLPAREIDALRAFLQGGKVDQKRADALAMLRAMRERQPGASPKRVDYRFAYTDAWDHVRQQAARPMPRPGPGPGAEATALPGVIEELQISGTFGRARMGALARALSVADAERRGVPIDAQALQSTAERFRRDRSLLEAKATEAWMRRHGLGADEFWELMAEEVQLRWAEAAHAPELARSLLSHLRVSGDYCALVTRAERKERALARLGLESPSLSDTGLSESELFSWYFLEWLNRPLPADLESHARGEGFADVSAFRRAVMRERCYQRIERAEPYP